MPTTTGKKNRLDNLVNRVEKSVDLSMRIAMVWFFGDIAYSVLPLVIVAIMNNALNKSFEKFLLLPEWSFASIVFFGLSVKYFTELKVRYQKDFSHKLYTGPQLYILLLIASVVTLMLIELSETILTMNTNYLAFLQLILFFIGAIALFVAIAFRELVIEQKENLPSKMDKNSYYSRLDSTLTSALKDIDYFIYMISKSKDIRITSSDDFSNSAIWDKQANNNIEFMLQTLEQTIREAKSTYSACDLYSSSETIITNHSNN